MEDRTENLAFEIRYGGDFENMRRDIKPAQRRMRLYLAGVMDNRRASHPRDMRIEPGLGIAVDHGADMHLCIARIANQKFARRPGDHRDHPIRYILLDAEKPKRRTALPGRAKCGGEHIIADLLGQGRRIGDHCVDPSGFRDQHRNWPVLRGQTAMDPRRGFH